MRFAFAPFGSTPAYDPAVAAGCDGLPPAKVSLSHWPGNTTPPDLRHDLSTGIALAFARLTPEERRERFGPLEFAVNDHFDGDGLLAIFACVNPKAALTRSEAMLLAAHAGDHWCSPSARSLAFDLAVSCHTDPFRSPLGSSLTPLSAAARDELAYMDLLARMPGALDDPWSLGSDIDAELRQVQSDLALLRSRDAQVEWHPAKHLAVIRVSRPIDPRAAFEVGACDRVIVVRQSHDGVYAEVRVSSASWFDTSSPRFPARPALDSLAARLQDEERGAGTWIARSGDDPFPSLEFGVSKVNAGVRDTVVEPRPSSLSLDAIVQRVVSSL